AAEADDRYLELAQLGGPHRPASLQNTSGHHGCGAQLNAASSARRVWNSPPTRPAAPSATNLERPMKQAAKSSMSISTWGSSEVALIEAPSGARSRRQVDVVAAVGSWVRTRAEPFAAYSRQNGNSTR